MLSNLLSRRDFTVRLAALVPVLGIGGTAVAATTGAPDDEISRTEESIRQVVGYRASRQRVYDALTDDQQFAKLTGLPATISRDAGGAFSMFGGEITGRHVELVPGERIVQAWRSESWKHGIYSIARFELTEQGSGTKLVLDHAGFPKGDADSLAAGWKSHYWGPLSKYLN
jgi:activator of HSP90 ATPase